MAFSAYAINYQEPDFGERVMFTGVTTNSGGAYNRTSSVFTCPSSGFYYVYFHLGLTIDDDGYDYCFMEIVLDGRRVATVSLHHVYRQCHASHMKYGWVGHQRHGV